MRNGDAAHELRSSSDPPSHSSRQFSAPPARRSVHDSSCRPMWRTATPAWGPPDATAVQADSPRIFTSFRWIAWSPLLPFLAAGRGVVPRSCVPPSWHRQCNFCLGTPAAARELGSRVIEERFRWSDEGSGQLQYWPAGWPGLWRPLPRPVYTTLGGRLLVWTATRTGRRLAGQWLSHRWVTGFRDQAPAMGWGRFAPASSATMVESGTERRRGFSRARGPPSSGRQDF